MSLSDDAYEYLATSPIMADSSIVTENTLVERAKESKQFPENIKKILTSPKTSLWIRNTITKKFSLSVEQAIESAILIREIIFGERSASTIEKDIETRLGISSYIAAQVSKDIMKEIISPNYFQIQRIYEKKNRRSPVEKPLPGNAPKISGMKNVVDLRSQIPPTLPPSPPPLPPTPPSSKLPTP